MAAFCAPFLIDCSTAEDSPAFQAGRAAAHRQLGVLGFFLMWENCTSCDRDILFQGNVVWCEC